MSYIDLTIEDDDVEIVGERTVERTPPERIQEESAPKRQRVGPAPPENPNAVTDLSNEAPEPSDGQPRTQLSDVFQRLLSRVSPEVQRTATQFRQFVMKRKRELRALKAELRQSLASVQHENLRLTYASLIERCVGLQEYLQNHFENVCYLRVSPAQIEDVFRLMRSQTEAELQTMQRLRQSATAAAQASSMNTNPNNTFYQSPGVVPLPSARNQDVPNAALHLAESIHTQVEALDLPPEIKADPFEHQRLGLGWLVKAEKSANKGGILADEMGLGKTVQTIALIMARRPDENSIRKGCRSTLIVCPKSMIDTWNTEIRERLHEDKRLKVLVYHSADGTGSLHRLVSSGDQMQAQFDVVITTYDMVRQECFPRRDNQPQPLFLTTWWRVVLDEAHFIKNPTSQRGKACAELKAQYRICLTGTPMQNNLKELWSLINFLHIKPYHQNRPAFERIIPSTNLSLNSLDSQVQTYDFSRMHALLAAILLRRTKDTVINGKKILDHLPSKTNIDKEFVLTDMEGYDKLSEEMSKKARKLQQGGLRTTIHLLALLTKLRQYCDHPLLGLTTQNAAQSRAEKIELRHVRGARGLGQDRITEIAEMKSEDLVCEACTTLLVHQDVLVLNPCGHFVCRDCKSTLPQLYPANDEDAACPACSKVVLDYIPHTTFTVLDKKSHLSNTSILDLLDGERQTRLKELRIRRQHRKNVLQELRSKKELSQAQDSDDDLFADSSPISNPDTSLDASFCCREDTDDLTGFLGENTPQSNGKSNDVEPVKPEQVTSVSSLETEQEEDAKAVEDLIAAEVAEAVEATEAVEVAEAVEATEVTEAIEATKDVNQTEATEVTVIKETAETDVQGVSEKAKDTKEIELIEDISTEATESVAQDTSEKAQPTETKPQNASEKAKSMYKLDIDEVSRLFPVPGVFEDGWHESTKVDELMSLLEDIWKEAPSDKVIIFSMFVSYLEILTVPLDAACIDYLMYTGAMDTKERTEVLRSFRSGGGQVLLTSLQAGNVGLTLTEANRVIIMEPYWNPYTEKQAQDRVHRIGQSKSVYVYRLFVKNTIEEKIVALQNRKLEVIDAALSSEGQAKTTRLSRGELQWLLETGPPREG